jgi:hypothetical protein
MATAVDLSQYLGSPKGQPQMPLPPKKKFTVWVAANPFWQTIVHFVVALGIATVDFILCYFVIEPNFPGFFPVSRYVVEIYFITILVISVRIVIDRETYKTSALQHFSSFCSGTQTLYLNASPESQPLIALLPVIYILCLRFKVLGRNETSDLPSDLTTNKNLANINDTKIFEMARNFKDIGIDFSKHLDIYQQASITESFYLSRSLNGFIWACVWIYATLVPFVLWGLYDGWLAYVGLLSTWVALALAHGFTRSIHLYDLYRKHDATPFDLMSYAIEQRKIMMGNYSH